jgi:hypothetical protein
MIKTPFVLGDQCNDLFRSDVLYDGMLLVDGADGRIAMVISPEAIVP